MRDIFSTSAPPTGSPPGRTHGPAGVKFDPAHGDLDRIRAVMDRIRAGAPDLSGGALTVVALAVEVGAPGNALTQRHTETKAEFYQLRGAVGRWSAVPTDK
jgi:hypothetical protein